MGPRHENRGDSLASGPRHRDSVHPRQRHTPLNGLTDWLLAIGACLFLAVTAGVFATVFVYLALALLI
ncbi:hypothetical protein BISA_1916 [Bifidobacterium saguini DSM 23967]|uniref:Uncharacterized protein n=2 Tax=Bifidobacterium saguini TaxID=762210 RepID=A0A087D5Y7_9BIFI|nr:hypothetical protein [Bifidobacterium saguini]KFI90937.1 hypothetical protein BISA_1916 [Bifidobacterium saguini DSM 23967]QTB91429.1 hypothetical protein BSD967_03130 [Bifidobacterium saguini]